MRVKVIRIHETGGPEVLQLEDVTLGDLGRGEVQVRHTAIGLNYIDTYHRSGQLPLPLPSGIGLEAAGVVEAVGPEVESLKIGDRVAYAAASIGAYTEARNLAAARVTKLPSTISDEIAAAVMLKGMTVRYLFLETYPLRAGQTILFHAAAGGVGLIAGQWAKALDVTAIGTVGSDEKLERARANGFAHVINYTTEDVVARLREITDGKGVPVVYDGVGKATTEISLDCLQPRGMLVSFGSASGPVTGFSFATLAAKGSLYVTRPTLMSYVGADDALQANANDVIDIVTSGRVLVDIGQRFALASAAEAHRALENRSTTGSTVLIP